MATLGLPVTCEAPLVGTADASAVPTNDLNGLQYAPSEVPLVRAGVFRCL